MPFKVIRNDITKVSADAIVNTANPYPVYARGTDARIYEAAGAAELLEDRKKIVPSSRKIHHPYGRSGVGRRESSRSGLSGVLSEGKPAAGGVLRV